MMPKGPSDNYFVPAVEKAFAVLELLATDNRGYGLSEVSRSLNLPVSTAKSLLSTMLRCGYLNRDDHRRYFLSMKLITTASRALNQIELRQIAHEELEELTRATGLASALSVRDGDHLVYIEKIESAGHIMPVVYVGKTMPLHSTATGKVLLAYLRDDQIEAIASSAGLSAYTEHTITSLPLLKKELERVRTQGYSMDNEETALGLVGIAAAVFDHNGNAVGAASAGGTSAEVQQEISAIITQVKSVALRISKRLGYQDTVVARSYRSKGRQTALRQIS
jgi:DNA-binding IclR family transcriptional regulator